METALRKLAKDEKDYTLARHELNAEEIVGEHFHPSADEWLFFEKGKLEVLLDFEKHTVNAGKGASVLYLPKSHVHGIKCLTDMSYFVLRGRKGKLVSLDELLKNAASAEPAQDPCGMLWELYRDGNLSLAYVRVTGRAKKHKHRVMQERYRVEQGSGIMQLGSNNISMRKGDVVVIPRHEWHFLRRATESPFEILVLTHPGYMPSDFIAAE